ncbi:MAG: hypothetical protein ABR570_06230 [Burkholderiales bacterium]
MKADDVEDGALWVVMQLALIVCLGAIAVWAWPSAMFKAPLSSLTIASVFWALLSLAIWLATLGWLWFVVEPVFKRNAGGSL